MAGEGCGRHQKCILSENPLRKLNWMKVGSDIWIIILPIQDKYIHICRYTTQMVMTKSPEKKFRILIIPNTVEQSTKWISSLQRKWVTIITNQRLEVRMLSAGKPKEIKDSRDDPVRDRRSEYWTCSKKSCHGDDQSETVDRFKWWPIRYSGSEGWPVQYGHQSGDRVLYVRTLYSINRREPF